MAFYNKEGTLIKTKEEFTRYIEDRDYIVVGIDTLSDGKVLSTAWTGVDLSNDGSMHIFETLLFDPDNNNKVHEQYRYSTEPDALAGHKRIKEAYENKFNQH